MFTQAASPASANLEASVHARRKRLSEGAVNLALSAPARIVTPSTLLLAVTAGIVLEHARGYPAASLLRVIDAVRHAAAVISDWEQRPRHGEQQGAPQ